MKKIFLLASAILGTTFSSLQAQETWSLEKCIVYAREHNIQLKQEELKANIQENNAKQKKISLLPSLNARATHNFSYGQVIGADNTYINQDVQSTNGSISSNVTLFNGFQKFNSIKQGQLDLKASLQDVEQAKEDLALNITSFYLEVLFKKELVQVAKDQLNITKLQINRTKELVKAGTVPKATLMEQEAQAAREEVQLVTSQNDLELAILSLSQLLDLESPKGFDILVPELPVINASKSLVDPQSVFISALEFRPQIKAAEYRLESSQKGLNIAKGQRCPELTAGASWSTRYLNYANFENRSFKDQIKEKESKGFGFQLDIPIFNGGIVNKNISNAKIQIDQSRFELENQKNILRKQIQQAYANALAAMKKFFSSETAVSATEEAFRYTEEKFSLGLVNSVEYNEAKTNLLKAKSDLLQAKYDYIFRTKILDFYNGIPIRL